MSVRLRLDVARGIADHAATGAPRVDRAARIIRGASAMQAVEALGHDVMIDATTLKQIAALGNAGNGIKVRFTHPGLCDDGMGKMLGRMKNFRVEGDKVVGDLHLADSASTSPEGDLATYVMDLAEEDPAAFGMSVVVTSFGAWKLPDGKEIAANAPPKRRGHAKGEAIPRPANATSDVPYLRIQQLHACDVVDEPAANRDGLFGDPRLAEAFSSTSNVDAADAFAAIDDLVARFGIGLPQAQSFISRYFAARLSKPPAGAKPVTTEPPMGISPVRLAELCKANPNHQVSILEMFAADKSEEEIVAAVAANEMTLLRASIVELTKERDDAKVLLDKQTKDHAAALAAKDAALAAALKDVEAFKKLGAGSLKDPGHTDPAKKDEKQKFTQAQQLAGKIPAELLESGNYDLTPA